MRRTSSCAYVLTKCLVSFLCLVFFWLPAMILGVSLSLLNRVQAGQWAGFFLLLLFFFLCEFNFGLFIEPVKEII
jgi:hypothetical protein